MPLDGIELREDKSLKEPIEVEIYTAYDDGPTFKVFVKRIPVKQHRRIFDQLDKIQNPTSKFAKQEVDRVEKEFLEAIVDRWEGCTPANWRCIILDGQEPVLRDAKGEEINDAVNHGKHDSVKQIPFTINNLFYLYRNSFQDRFGRKITEAAKRGAEVEIEKEADEKNA